MKLLPFSRAIAGLCLIAFATSAAAQTFSSNPGSYPYFMGQRAVPSVTVDNNGNYSNTVNDVSTPFTGTGGVSSATVGVSSAQALAAGTRTYMLALQNVSASASIACAFGAAAALNTAGSFQLGPGQMLTFNSTYVPQDAINCIASAASTPLTVIAK